MNTKIETVSKINFFGDMIGSPVFILISSLREVATLVKSIIIQEGITTSIFIATSGDGVDDLIDQVEFPAIYPDIIIVDDWNSVEVYEYLKNIEYFTVITMRMVDSKIEGFDKFDYIVDNRGTYEMLEAVLTSIVDSIFKH